MNDDFRATGDELLCLAHDCLLDSRQSILVPVRAWLRSAAAKRAASLESGDQASIYTILVIQASCANFNRLSQSQQP
jgi:hypothetical protein